MWFALSLVAMFMLVARRSTEKTLSSRLPSTAMAWLQQLFALPAMVLLLPFAAFYLPGDLSAGFYAILIAYTVMVAVDVILYFKAISVGDISIISSILTLTIVSGLIGTYLFLGQTPTAFGVLGSALILAGAFLAGKPHKHAATAINNKLAIILILIIVVLRGIYTSMEVVALRETNPIYFNFVTSLITVPIIMAIMYVRRKRAKKPFVSKELASSIKSHAWLLIFIGVTYTINLTCTFAAKSIASDAAYVTTIKSTQVLPMAILGVLLFKEKIIARQWVGLGLITAGLAAFVFA